MLTEGVGWGGGEQFRVDLSRRFKNRPSSVTYKRIFGEKRMR